MAAGRRGERSSAQLWLMRGIYLTFLLRATYTGTGPGMPNAFSSTWQEGWLLMPPNTSLQLKSPFCCCCLKTVVPDRPKVAEFMFAFYDSWPCVCGQQKTTAIPFIHDKEIIKYSCLALAYSLSGTQSEKSVSGALSSETVCHFT